MIQVTIQHDTARHRFYAAMPDGSEAELCYEQDGKTLNFHRTYVPEAFRTEGVAEQVVLAGFRYAEEQGFRVIPTCPYVSRGFLRRHPEYQPFVLGA